MAAASGSQSVKINSPASHVLEILRDTAGQTRWFPGMIEAKVLETDAQGRTTKVHQITDAKVAKDEYDLAITQTDSGYSWTLASSSKIQKRNNGSWQVRDIGGGQSEATMSVDIDTSLPLPGFVVKKTMNDTLKGATKGLKGASEK